jgi:Tol biopolymer transport system component
VVAFQSDATNLVGSDTNGVTDIFTRDRKTKTTRRVNLGPGAAQADSFSGDPYISTNGRWVAFHSFAENLVASDTNSAGDMFVRDRRAGKTRRVSVSSAGAQGNSDSGFGLLSGDGRFVIFQSDATNLIASDTNGFTDVYVRGPLH